MKKETKPQTTQSNEIETLIAENEKLKIELEEAKQLQIRALADLQNVQRRESEQKSMWSRDAVVFFFQKLIPRLNEVMQCGKHTQDKNVQKTITTFLESLEKQGLVMINPKQGDVIDPNIHEVLLVAEGKKDTVVSVLEIGWQFQDRVITPAKISGGQDV